MNDRFCIKFSNTAGHEYNVTMVKHSGLRPEEMRITRGSDITIVQVEGSDNALKVASILIRNGIDFSYDFPPC